MSTKLHRKWFLKEWWDFDVDPPAASDEDFGKAILACANGDGTLSQAERDWVIGYLATTGTDGAILDELKSYDANEDVLDVVARVPHLSASANAIIYDAVRACDADGDLNEMELATIQRMATTLGSSDEAVSAIREVYEEEKHLKAKRLGLIFPEGSPF